MTFFQFWCVGLAGWWLILWSPLVASFTAQRGALKPSVAWCGVMVTGLLWPLVLLLLAVNVALAIKAGKS